MIRRATLNDVVEVNRLLGRDFPGCDFTEVLANPLNVCLLDGESGTIFAWRGPRTYEAHVFYAARGQAALRIINSALDEMQSTYGARLFWALVPIEKRHVRMFARLVGWASDGVLETQHGPCELFVSEKIPCLQW